jgi:hypothetical protein
MLKKRTTSAERQDGVTPRVGRVVSETTRATRSKSPFLRTCEASHTVRGERALLWFDGTLNLVGI